MLTWYDEPKGRLAYSVRPDLWPAGSWVAVRKHGQPAMVDALVSARGTDRAYLGRTSAEAVQQGLDQPGVGEAMVMAGLVSAILHSYQAAWAECD